MSTQDFSHDGLRVGRWVPDTTTGTATEAGTVYRGGSLAVSQVRVEPVDGVPDRAPTRRGLRILTCLALAAGVVALSLMTLLGAPRSDAAREIGTMRYPAPLSPAPPALGPPEGVSSGSAARSGRPSTSVGDVAPIASAPPAAAADGSPPPAVMKPTAGAPVGPPPAGPTPTSPPTVPEQGEVTVPLAVGATVSLETMAKPGHLLRHDSTRAVVGRVGLGSSADARASARFVVRAGLAGRGCVSFESEDRPGRFLRHWNFAVYLHRPGHGSLFAKDATFCPVTGADGVHISLRSENFPDRYLTVRSSLLFLDRADGAAERRIFAVRPGA